MQLGLDDVHAARAAVAHANLLRPTVPLDQAEEHELLLAMLDQLCGVGATKRFPPPQIGERLQEARLPGGVITVNQIEVRPKLQLDVFQAAKMAGLERAYHKSVGTRLPYSLIGITTNVLSWLPG